MSIRAFLSGIHGRVLVGSSKVVKGSGCSFRGRRLCGSEGVSDAEFAAEFQGLEFSIPGGLGFRALGFGFRVRGAFASGPGVRNLEFRARAICAWAPEFQSLDFRLCASYNWPMAGPLNKRRCIGAEGQRALMASAASLLRLLFELTRRATPSPIQDGKLGYILTFDESSSFEGRSESAAQGHWCCHSDALLLMRVLPRHVQSPAD